MTAARWSRSRLVLAILIVGAGHWVAQWVAWATHPGNSAPPSATGPSILWSVLSFPLFYLVPDTLASGEAFSALLAGNSLLWGITAAVIYSVIRARSGAATASAKPA